MMKYKFFGTPNMLVKQRVKQKLSLEFKYKPLFRFDPNGEFVTDNAKLIEKLKKKFKFEEVKEETKDYTCKQCGETFENKGLLLAHYRQEHPKG